MNLFHFILFIFSCPFQNAFIQSHNKNISPLISPHIFVLSHPPNRYFYKERYIDKIKKKCVNISSLIRIHTIFPTLFIQFSGAWILHPSLSYIFHSPHFFYSLSCTLFIMFSGMIFDNIVDQTIDKINVLSCASIIKKVTLYEAFALISFFLGITEWINLFFLPAHVQSIIHISIVTIFLYTLVYKRIYFMKNIICAGLFAFSFFLGGISVSNTILSLHPHFDIFSIALSMIFIGSLYNELLLDIHDYEKDSINNIQTIPVLFGKYGAWKLANILLYGNILYHSCMLMYFQSIEDGVLLPILCYSLFVHIYEIYTQNYAKHTITNSITHTYIILCIVLFYLDGLALLREYNKYMIRRTIEKKK